MVRSRLQFSGINKHYDVLTSMKLYSMKKLTICHTIYIAFISTSTAVMLGELILKQGSMKNKTKHLHQKSEFKRIIGCI